MFNIGVINGGVSAYIKVGKSITRIFRLAGIPSVVVGCTPFGMGPADDCLVGNYRSYSRSPNSGINCIGILELMKRVS